MNPLPSPPPDRSAALAAGLATSAVVRLTVDQVAALRKAPGPACGDPLSVSLLKHLDEQTLAVLVALERAIRASGRDPRTDFGCYREWGIVAAPRWIGRGALVPNMARFHAEGAWGVSPHLVPHKSLHSVSGLVSQSLRIQGPNFGAGCGPGFEPEGLLAGFTLLDSMALPGVWLLFSRITPEGVIADDGRYSAESSVQAIALALVPAGSPQETVRLEWAARPSAGGDEIGFEDLAGWLERGACTEGAIEGVTGRLSFSHVRQGVKTPGAPSCDGGSRDLHPCLIRSENCS